jgi:hypothetical protein
MIFKYIFLANDSDFMHDFNHKLKNNEIKNKKPESEVRHNINVMNEKKKLEQRANDYQEKLMKKYITFYWNKRNMEQKQKNNYQHFNKKYDGKNNRLEEFEKNIEQKRKNLIKKFRIIEANQQQIKEKDRQKYEDIRKKRNEYIKTCIENKIKLQKELIEQKDEILEYQTFMISRKSQMDKRFKLKKNNVTEKTLHNQLNFEKNLKPFFKRLEKIKSESIIKRRLTKRKKIYRDIKRAEAEARRKEEEEKLLNQKID